MWWETWLRVWGQGKGQGEIRVTENLLASPVPGLHLARISSEPPGWLACVVGRRTSEERQSGPVSEAVRWAVPTAECPAPGLPGQWTL